MSINSLVTSSAGTWGAYWASQVLANPLGPVATRAWWAVSFVSDGIVAPYVERQKFHDPLKGVVALVFVRVLDMMMKRGVLAACGVTLSFPYFILLLGVDSLAKSLAQTLLTARCLDWKLKDAIDENPVVDYLGRIK